MIRKWLKLSLCLFLIAVAFWLSGKIEVQNIPVIKEIEQQNLDASALFYTESPVARKNYFKLLQDRQKQ